MKLRDLRIGDVVQSPSWHGIPSAPMTVVAIFAYIGDLQDPDTEEGTVYLDFEGNEGDVWEEDVKNLQKLTTNH